MPASAADIEALVTSHLPLVGHLAREAASRLPRHLGTDDLAGAGALALVQAAHTFNPDLGVPFARFAATRIRGAMIDHMRQRDWATRSLRSRARALDEVAERLTAAMSRTPTNAEVATASGLSEAEVREVRQGTDRAVLLSLDPLNGEDEGLAASLEDTTLRPDDALVAAERLGYLRDAIEELPPRPRYVVRAYYLDQRPLTEIAAELGVTQSRTSQLRAEGLDLLREALQTLLRDDDSRARRSGSAGASQTSEADLGAQPSVMSGAGTQEACHDGVRARRREAYVTAVAQHSTVRERADVQAYLTGASLTAGAADSRDMDHPLGL